MEPGASSSTGSFRWRARPKRPSAVRDFPPGCGAQPRPAGLRPGAAKVAAVRQFPGAAGFMSPGDDKAEGGVCRPLKSKSEPAECVRAPGDDTGAGPRQLKSTGNNSRDLAPRRSSSGCLASSNHQDNQVAESSRVDNMRIKVTETLKLFRDACKEIEKGKGLPGARRKHLGESSTSNHDTIRRVDLMAASLLKAEDKYINTEKIIGSVPGIEVGDKFQYRVELAIVGLHHKLQNGIDYLKDASGRVVAASVVSSGEYDHIDGNSGSLIYMGEGGKASGRGNNKEMAFRDQRLVRGNLALKNSIGAQNPVRVIRRRGCYYNGSGSGSGSGLGSGYCFVYDGLYVVKKYWQKRGSHGKLVFMYELTRKSDEPRPVAN